MAQFGSHDAWVRYHQAEGFRVGLAQCRSSKCHNQWWCAVHPDCVAWKLECPKCHKQNNYFSEMPQVAEE